MAYRFSEDQANVVFDNFYAELEELSGEAQTMPHHASKTVRRFSGVAESIIATCEECINLYGLQASAEALEEVRNTYRDMNELTYYYDSDNPDIVDLQEQFIQEFSSFLLEAAHRIEEEARRIEEEEEEERRREEEEEARRQEEEETRARAREQAERAREIEEKYNDIMESATADSVLSQIGKGILKGIGQKLSGRFSNPVTRIFNKIFRGKK